MKSDVSANNCSNKTRPRDSKGRFVSVSAKRTGKSKQKKNAGKQHSPGKKTTKMTGSTTAKKSGGVQIYKGRKPTRSELNYKKTSGGSKEVIIVDESNSFSGGSRLNLTVVSTRVRNRNQFLKLRTMVRDKDGKLRKYSGSRYEDASPIIEAIAHQDIIIVESHESISDAKNAESRKEMYLRNVKASVNDAVDTDPSKLTDVLIDSPPVDANKEIEQYGKSLTQTGKNIGWFETGSSNGNVEIQIHDFITGTIGDNIEDIEKGRRLFDKLSKVFKRRDES